MSFRLIPFLAGKFSDTTKKQRFINFARAVAFLSVFLGTVALIISLSVLSGYEKALLENSVKFISHISVSAFNRKPLEHYKESISKVRNSIPEVKDIEPVIQRESLIRSASNTEGVMIKGITGSYDINSIRKNIKTGKFLDFSVSGAKEIVVGKRLAIKLNVKPGDTIIIYAMRESPDISLAYPNIEQFVVSGIYETGLAKYDEMITYIPFSTAVNLFRMPPGAVTNYEIMLNDITNISDISDKVEDVLGYPHFCFTVFELQSSVFAWIELQKEPIPIVLGLITIIAVFNIFTVLLITVVEKTYSIGILSALGLQRKKIISLFVYKGMMIGLTGTAAGSLAAFLFCRLQQSYGLIRLNGDIYFLDVLPVNIDYIHYLIVWGLTLFLSFIATFIPSYIASKANPIRAIHYH